jgi:hypothetical protein
MMHAARMTYDNSVSANPGRDAPPYWPQTMDHTFSWVCQNEDCPVMSHPGIWQIPLNQFYGDFVPQLNGFKRSAMMRAAMSLNGSEASTGDLLWANFNRAYRSNRAPYVLTMNGDFLHMLDNDAIVRALDAFVQKLSTQHPDVWFVTMRQLVDWLRSPVPASRMQVHSIIIRPRARWCHRHSHHFTAARVRVPRRQ